LAFTVIRARKDLKSPLNKALRRRFGSFAKIKSIMIRCLPTMPAEAESRGKSPQALRLFLVHLM